MALHMVFMINIVALIRRQSQSVSLAGSPLISTSLPVTSVAHLLISLGAKVDAKVFQLQLQSSLGETHRERGVDWAKC